LKRGVLEKNVTSRFHLFPSKNVSLKSDKSNIGYYSDVFCKLENKHLNGIFCSVLPEKRFIW